MTSYSLLLSMLTILPAGDRFTFHAGAGALATKTLEDPGAHLVGGQVFLGDVVFAFTGLAIDDRHAVGRPRP